MKKAILFLALVFLGQEEYAQFLPSGTSTTNERYRSGSLGIGYTSLPVFGNFKFKVNGRSQFENGTLVIGNDSPTWYENNLDANFWGIKSSRSILVKSDDPNYSEISVSSQNSVGIQLAASNCNGCYSKNALQGDAVIRANVPNLILANEFGGNIKFSSNSASGVNDAKVHLIIKPGTGNVGIGTDAPDAKLAVNGLIHTKEVKVDLIGWPDYVFTNEYKLPTLKEVEKQINEKGHLANIPSAAEVENNGVLLGEINKKLLEKVEELTLYIIQMNKEIELLKEKIKN